MKAIVRDRYGGPEVLELREVETPSPGLGETLVRVRASSVNMADVDYILGRPRVGPSATGLRVPRARIPGIDMAGEIESVGPDTMRFKAGDRVLVNGASGNVGPFAVQIAMSFGAEVTGVCRTEKMAMVREVGADHVIDYTAQDNRESG